MCIYIYIKTCTHNPNPLSSIAPEPGCSPWAPCQPGLGDEEDKSWAVTESRVLKEQTCPPLSQGCTWQTPCSEHTELIQSLPGPGLSCSNSTVTQGVPGSPSAAQRPQQRKPASSGAGFVLLTGQLLWESDHFSPWRMPNQ